MGFRVISSGSGINSIVAAHRTLHTKGSRTVLSVQTIAHSGHSLIPLKPSPQIGTLAVNSPYVVSRIMLYCDDFRKNMSLAQKGSAGGCYMVNLGMPPEWRNGKATVRVVSLTPPGVSKNDILLEIIPDIVRANVFGIDGRDPSGQRIKIFLDAVAFVGDYTVAAHTLDLNAHNAKTLCTLCVLEGLRKTRPRVILNLQISMRRSIPPHISGVENDMKFSEKRNRRTWLIILLPL